MSQARSDYGDPHIGKQARLLDRFASEALAAVARNVRASKADPDGSALDRLYSAAIGADPRACVEVARALIADGVLAERICDLYIPAAARRMGADWQTDDLSFSAVTIGTARLQALLRELGLGAEVDQRWTAGGDAVAVLLVAPETDHTLGALVLASQIRRRGLSVRLSLGESSAALVESLKTTPFDAIFFSASISDSLLFLEEALEKIGASFAPPPPMVLGGVLLEHEAQAAAIVGIDLVTSDLDEAIQFCGLTAA